MLPIVTIVGISASVFTALALLPQLVKIVKSKEAHDVSTGTFIVLFIGLSLWIWYGCMIADYIIIVSNSFSVAVNLSIITLSLKYKAHSRNNGKQAL